jgi:hypothetical protein
MQLTELSIKKGSVAIACKHKQSASKLFRTAILGNENYRYELHLATLRSHAIVVREMGTGTRCRHVRGVNIEIRRAATL